MDGGEGRGMRGRGGGVGGVGGGVGGVFVCFKPKLNLN